MLSSRVICCPATDVWAGSERKATLSESVGYIALFDNYNAFDLWNKSMKYYHHILDEKIQANNNLSTSSVYRTGLWAGKAEDRRTSSSLLRVYLSTLKNWDEMCVCACACVLPIPAQDEILKYIRLLFAWCWWRISMMIILSLNVKILNCFLVSIFVLDFHYSDLIWLWVCWCRLQLTCGFFWGFNYRRYLSNFANMLVTMHGC